MKNREFCVIFKKIMANLPLNRVRALYYKEGLTVHEVAEKLETTPSVVFKFMKKQELPRRTLHEVNRKRLSETPLSFRVKEKLSAEEKELKIAGIMLYWGEGTKGGHNVEFSNSDPKMIQMFLRLLREIFMVDESRLRVYLYCYADQDIKGLKNYWSTVTRIPVSQFTKPYIRKDFQKKTGREMKYGLVHIRYSDTRLLRLIESWIKEYSK